MTRSSLLTHIHNAIAFPSRENFCSAFAMVLQHLQLTDNEVAKIIQVSRPTIGRWARGETAPHPIGQTVILDYFRKKVVEHEES